MAYPRPRSPSLFLGQLCSRRVDVYGWKCESRACDLFIRIQEAPHRPAQMFGSFGGRGESQEAKTEIGGRGSDLNRVGCMRPGSGM